MQLGQAETLGGIDHHHARVWHVDADFDHACGNEHLRAARAKVGHRLFFFARRHAAVDHANAKRRPARRW